MSSITGLGTPQTENNASQGASSKSAKDLGQTEFLKLLVTQLENQDPMNPMDNQQFIAQLATFSSLEQLISINRAVSRLAGISPDTGQAESSVANPFAQNI